MRPSYTPLDPLTLRNYISDVGLKPKENSRSYVFDCPRCKHKDKLYIEKRTGRFICFYCAEIDGFQGRVEYALSELLGLAVERIKVALYGLGNVNATAQITIKLIDLFGDEEPPEEFTEPLSIEWPTGFLPLDDKHSARGAEYLAGRGIPLEVAMEYGIRYCPMKRAVAFPVRLNGKLYGYQTRLVIPHKGVTEEGVEYEGLKVLSSKGIPRSMVMFGDKIEGSDRAVVCEGPVDALKAHLVGGNICTMGKAVTPAQVRLIRESGVRKVYLALDPDAAAEVGRLVREFYDPIDGCEVYYVEVPPRSDGKKADLGELSMEEARDLILNARRVDPSNLFIFLED